MLSHDSVASVPILCTLYNKQFDVELTSFSYDGCAKCHLSSKEFTFTTRMSFLLRVFLQDATEHGSNPIDRVILGTSSGEDWRLVTLVTLRHATDSK